MREHLAPLAGVKVLPILAPRKVCSYVCECGFPCRFHDGSHGFCCAWIIMQLGKYTGPHPSPGGTRILQALRLGGAGK